MSSVSIEQLHVRLGNVDILKDIDLQVEDGEFLVLLGPSGCGKSTLLHSIAGLLDVHEGAILIDGKDVTWADPKDRSIGMVFQSYALYPTMNVERNMSFGLRINGTPKAEINKRVQRAANMLHLTPLLNRKPAQLSGGQRQRVAIGRAIVRAPKVFLFDEPLSNLDAALRGNTRVEIHKLHRALGATSIYVTHDQVEAMTLADRVVVLRDGLIEQVGTPMDLYDRPANQFVAQFIGMPSMNMVDARAVPSFSSQTGGRLPSDGFLGVRPEGLRVHPKPGAGAPGRVELIEALGSDTLIHVDVGGVPLVARQNDRTELQAGDEVAVELDPSVLHFFNREGRALAA
jgi:multiple sugar transport system ATP-binding protein